MTRWALLGMLLAGSVGATTLVRLDVAALARTSDVVVRGTVVRVEPRWSGDRARIVTDAEVQVAEVLKGAVGKVLVATQPGGEIGDVGQKVHGAARFEVGTDVVLFLERRGARFTVTGMAQGAFVVRQEGRTLVARQRDDEALSLVDPVTHQSIDAPPLALPYAQLVATVRAPAIAPTPAVTPVTP